MAATPAMVANELGRSTPTTEQAAQWQRWIERALRDIQNRYGSRFANLDTALVDDTIVAAVADHARRWRETAESRYSVAVDDGREERTYSKDSGPFTVPDWVWDVLDGDTSRRSFSITPQASHDVGLFDSGRRL